LERWIGSDSFCFEVADLAEREENAETEIQPSTDEMHATVMRQCSLAIGKADFSPINEMQPPEICEHPFVIWLYPRQEEGIGKRNEETCILLAHADYDARTLEVIS